MSEAKRTFPFTPIVRRRIEIEVKRYRRAGLDTSGLEAQLLEGARTGQVTAR